jgi:tRNA A-37 threonylcarbamoyl transferase component Bud32
MAVEAQAQREPRTVIEESLDRLARNAPPETILPQLREIEPLLPPHPVLRAQFLRARAIATNRLGFGSEALGDLYEARGLLETADDAAGLARVFLTIATVFIWRGDSREAALSLLRAVAEGDAAGDRTATALALIEAGRLQIENGRAADARAILGRALEIAGDTIPRHDYQRAWINLLQATVAAGQTDKALALRAAAGEILAGASPRLTMLERLESSRIDRLAGDLAAARAALREANALAPANQEAFERVEIAAAEAELAMGESDAAEAARLLHDVVIARYASDDLAAREVQARLLHAHALEAMNQREEADRTLGAALRRAIACGLSGYADQVRSRIAARGSDEAAGLTGDVPAEAVSPHTAARFVRQRPLGAGGFGKVVRAYDLELGVEVAIKRSTLKDVYDPALRGRLLEAARTEVEATSRLNHPGIARVYGLLADVDGDSLLVEEFVDGPTLRQAIQAGLDPHKVYDILARVAFALAAVHATGVIHRDIKPDNIILRGGSAPVLVDFGIAVLSEGGDIAHGGTPGYMAPEQARGSRVDARSDLYALGITAYEMLLGRLPEAARSFGPAIVSSLWQRRRMRSDLIEAGVDAEAAGLIADLTAAHARWRPPTAVAVGTQFAGIASRIPLGAAKA